MTNVHELFPGASALPEPPADRLICERDVLKYRPMLGQALLLAARKAETITYTPGKRGSAWYRLADVDAYLKSREKPCLDQKPDPSSSSGDNGSPKSRGEEVTIVSGMTPELAEHVAQASAQRFLKPRKVASRKLS